MQTIKVLKLSFCLSLAFIFSACQQEQKTNDEETTEEVVKEVTATERITEESFESIDFEPNHYKAIIKELKGIEKFFVQDDLLKLYSLLKYKDDSRYKALKDDLQSKYEYPQYFVINLLDTKNGYIEFAKPQTECRHIMVYWNKSNGEKLIVNSLLCCTMFCDGDLTFQIYDDNNESFTSVEIKEIIPDIEYLWSIRPENLIEGDGYDSEIILPRNGKNIRYCVEEKCLDLIWQDGTFSVLK